MTTSRKRKVVIIGAGIAGLAAANRLQKASGDSISVSILEGGPRIGGRILTSEFSGDRIELGATLIQGIEGSPVYALACQTNSMSASDNHERMDVPPTNPVTLSEARHGDIVNPALVEQVSTLFKSLTASIKDSGQKDDDSVRTRSGEGVGAYLRRGLKEHFGSALTCTAEALFEMEMNDKREWTSADDMDDLNLLAESEYKDLPGEFIPIPKGYSRVVEAMASALPEGVIRLNKLVRRVNWCGADGKVRVCLDGGEVVECDHVVVTVSLGVLKAGSVEFEPELPDFKKGAIGRLGYGVVDKLFMEVAEGCKGGRPLPYVQLAFDGRKAEIPWWMRKCVSLAPIYEASNVLLTWLAGKEAVEVEELDEEEVVRGINATLAAFSVDYGRVARVKRSGWGKDPLFLGSYSYVAAGSSGDDLDLMAEPLPGGMCDMEEMKGVEPLQILFAGEATDRTHYSTTHGSYFSGVREANRLLEHLRLL